MLVHVILSDHRSPHVILSDHRPPHVILSERSEREDPENHGQATRITIASNSTHITNVHIQPGNETNSLDSRMRPTSLLSCVAKAMQENSFEGQAGDDGKEIGNDEKEIRDDVKVELEKYFSNPKHIFNLPLDPHGTEFQKRVWKALQEIPSGETLTYGELAKKLNSHPRAVGQACRRNPIPVIIPCHRVVAQNGLGGYSGERIGALMDFKKQLLAHEGVLT